MIDPLLGQLMLLPLDVIIPSSASPSPGVAPNGSNGFAAQVVIGGFFGVGLLIITMILLGLRPKRGDTTARS